MAAFGTKLREVRGNIERKELAERSGFSVGYIADLENGRYPNPSADTIYKMAKALGVGCDAFADCDFSGEKKPASGKRGRPNKK